MTPGQRTLIERLRCERLSLRGICRAVGVRLPWLLHCMVERFAACPEQTSPKFSGSVPFSVKADEGGLWNTERRVLGKEVRVSR
jgi:hypothetical protein